MQKNFDGEPIRPPVKEALLLQSPVLRAFLRVYSNMNVDDLAEYYQDLDHELKTIPPQLLESREIVNMQLTYIANGILRTRHRGRNGGFIQLSQGLVGIGYQLAGETAKTIQTIKADIVDCFSDVFTPALTLDPDLLERSVTLIESFFVIGRTYRRLEIPSGYRQAEIDTLGAPEK